VGLHTGPIQADVTFGSGCFYRGIDYPELCFDLVPRKPGVIAADVCRLPLKDACLRSVMFDPPFLIKTGPGAKLKERFGSQVGNMQDLILGKGNGLDYPHKPASFPQASQPGRSTRANISSRGPIDDRSIFV